MMYRYSGKNFSQADLETIRRIIRDHPDDTRAQLSREVCREFEWLKRDGKLKEMSCRVAMLKMYRDGLIELPPAKYPHHGGSYDIEMTTEADPKASVRTSVNKLQGLRLTPVDTSSTHLWNEYIDRYHYLGYRGVPGDQLRYFIEDDSQHLGVMGFSAAAWWLGPRDQFIGWTDEQRERNLHLVVQQSRLLILPWIKCENLVSKSLSLVVRCLGGDWQRRYGYRPVLIETFVLKSRYCGTSYKSANWINVGDSQGRGRFDCHDDTDEQVKSIWLYPLERNFREQLGGKSGACRRRDRT